MTALAADLVERALGGAAGLLVAVAPLDGGADDLVDAERALLVGKAPSRAAELATGRRLAARLIGALGLARTALLVRADRAPAWPPGIVGSISHAGGHCAVAVGRAEDFAWVALDVEVDRPLEPAVRATVCSAAELAAFAASPLGADLGARVAFGAKECVQKAVGPRVGRVLEFADYVVDVDVAGAWTARCAVFDPALPRALDGRWRRAGGFVVAGAVGRR